MESRTYGRHLLKYEEARREIERLRKENARLMQLLNLEEALAQGQQKQQLSLISPTIQEAVPLSERTAMGRTGINQFASVKEKIVLYRSLFRGREDVYPVRWTNKQGKSGYSPACAREWTAICEKPRVKCFTCPHQAYLPVTDEVIANHLKADTNFTVGVYPMLEDESCWFLAMDFDKANWKQDAEAVMQTCRDHGISAALERSRSGNGGHIWIFFSEALPAYMARRLGTILLSLTMNSRYQLGLDSYDRLFPNQDTMPKGGFGNLIALPLQGGPRKAGNSVFIDENGHPYQDQWWFLSEIRRLSAEEVVHFIGEHATEDQLGWVDMANSDEAAEPWERKTKDTHSPNLGTMPNSIKLVLSDRLYIPKQDLPPGVIHDLMKSASFPNPDFYKAQAMRLSTFGKPRVISCAEMIPHHIVLPRGCMEQTMDYFRRCGVEVTIEDKCFLGEGITAEFIGELTMLQDAAVRTMTTQDIGILSAATGFGKTVVAAGIIARRKVNTLILFHRRELMDQWRERMQTFHDIPKSSIGVVGGGKEKRTGKIDIAVIQSLNRKGEIKDFVQEYGQVIVDECHHLSAFSFEQVLMRVKAKYLIGLTATPKRQDGQEAIVMMQPGPIRMNIDARALTSMRSFTLTVVPRYTSFRLPDAMTMLSIQDVYQLLVNDEDRNTMIFDDLLRVLDEGRSPLLLVERTSHAEYFEQRLQSFAKNVIFLRGGMGKIQREAVRARIAAIPDHEERVFIATGKLIGEGFDDARLDTLFLVHPISWSGTLQQYAGRLHRTHANKSEVKVYDYVDIQVPVLIGMYKKRVKGYRKMGYQGAEL